MFFGSKKNTTSPEPSAVSLLPSSNKEMAPPAPQPRVGNGATGPALANPLNSQDARLRPGGQLTTAFVQTVTLLMRSPAHKHLRLGDLGRRETKRKRMKCWAAAPSVGRHDAFASCAAGADVRIVD